MTLVSYLIQKTRNLYTKSIAEALNSVLSNERLRENLIIKGYERAKQFSWEKMAQESLNAYYIAYEHASKG